MLLRTSVASKFTYLLLIVFSLALHPSRAFADELVILEVYLNTEKVDSFMLILTSDADVLIKREDLESTRLIKGLGRDIIYTTGETFVSLRSIKGMEFSIDESTVSLNIKAKVSLFKPQRLNLGHKDSKDIDYPAQDSAFLNYAYRFDSSVSSSYLSTEFGLRLGDYLGLSTFNYVSSDVEEKFVRLLTSLRTDSRGGMVTYVLGDRGAHSGTFGSAHVLGGLSISKNFSINPYFIKYPSLSFSGFAETPSEVDVYVNGLLVKELTLGPGKFELGNLTTEVGSGISRVIVKDIYGSEMTFSEAFFYSDKLLAKGLHEYSYNLGFIREELGEESFEYGGLTFIGTHNYGFYDNLMGGYSLEASDDLISGGFNAISPLYEWGVLSGALAFSSSEGKSGSASKLDYSFQSKSFSTVLSLTQMTRGFSTLTIGALDDKTAHSFISSVGLSLNRAGSVSLSYSKSRVYIEPSFERVSFSYNKVINKSASLFSSISRSITKDVDATDEIFLGVHINLDGSVTANGSYTNKDGESSYSASVQKPLPTNTGYGYRLRYDDTDSEYAEALYQNRYGIYSAGYRSIRGGENYSFSIAGGVGYVGTLFMSRPILDSFALVRTGDLEGVDVYMAGNLIGSTDVKGELVVPTVRSFFNNRINVDPADVPIEFGISKVSHKVNLQYRSGVCIDFDVERISGLTGNVITLTKEGLKPADFKAGTLNIDKEVIEFQTGSAGLFYIEFAAEKAKLKGDGDIEVKAGKCLSVSSTKRPVISPGVYSGTLKYEEKSCTFRVDIKEITDIFIDLGEVVCDLTAGEPKIEN